MNDAFIATPQNQGCFCHNKLCSLSAITGFPEDFFGPIPVDMGTGEKEVMRINATAHQRPKLVFFLCETCNHAVKIAAGYEDPTVMPTEILSESEIIQPH